MDLSLAQLPTPALGEIERWLVAAAAVGALALLWRRLFGNGHTLIRRAECSKRHDSVEQRLVRLCTRLYELQSGIDQRLTALETAVARIDERTQSKT